MSDNNERSALGTIYDRTMRSLHGVPDTVHTKATTVRTMSAVLELSQTFVVQTYRHRELGDTIFVEYLSVEGHTRIALPAAVAECIARQRDALTTKNRRAAGKAQAAQRKAQGIQPAFLAKKGKRS